MVRRELFERVFVGTGDVCGSLTLLSQMGLLPRFCHNRLPRSCK